jgi:phosphate transport system substrate-binding protein
MIWSASAGTGMGLRAMERLGEQLAGTKGGILVKILPSLGTTGGINALLDGAIDIALAARPIKPAEQQKGLRQAVCLTTALVFATSKVASYGVAEEMSSARLPAVYTDPQPLWPDRTPMRIVLRSQAGSEVPYLIDKIPAMAAAFGHAYKRGSLPVGMTDKENVELALKIKDSLAITTLLQIRAENIALRPLRFDGVDPTAASLADGRYPLPLQMCLLVAETPAPATARFIAHLQTPSGATLLRSFDTTLTK